MASQRFKTIFERNISQFVGHFSEDASSIFFDEKNILIHPGEYGRYREDSCKHMLRLVLDNRSAISDGFVFTSNNQITTQCDIVVYNSMMSPIIADDITKMFPVEEVRMVGEIKSSLDKNKYIDALRKLANNKKIMLEGRTGIAVNSNSGETYNTIATFLICSKLNFNYNELDYEEIYKDIDRKYWHNAILSIEDGFFTYALDLKKASDKVQTAFRNVGYKLDNMGIWPYPLFDFKTEKILTKQNHVYIKQTDKYHHIIDFFVNISKCNKEVWTYAYDPVVYLGLNTEPFFEN